MGNRAVIAFTQEGKKNKKTVGIYLHWNGGRDSVEGLLQAAKDYGIRGGDYGVARLIQIICNTFPGCLGVGVDLVEVAPAYDPTESTQILAAQLLLNFIGFIFHNKS